MSFNIIPENKMLAKISEFTVFVQAAKRKILLHENNKDVDLQAPLRSLIFTL